MILNAFYSMIEYIDIQDFTNSGVQMGKIAYYLQCMAQGKSLTGFF